MLTRALRGILGLALIVAAGCSHQEQTASPPAGGPTPGAATPGGTAATSTSNLTIAVIPKGTTHAFWKSVEAGARSAGQELGVQINWKGPLKESDRAGQIAIVEQFISSNVSGIVLAPLDDTALVKPVQSAMAKKIPVVIFDSALKGTPGKDFVAFATSLKNNVIYTTTADGQVRAIVPVFNAGMVGEIVMQPIHDESVASAR